MDILINMLRMLLILNLENMIPSVDREFVDPIAELGAHVAPLGIAFYDGKEFPEKYHNSLFIALHGSWNKIKNLATKLF